MTRTKSLINSKSVNDAPNDLQVKREVVSADLQYIGISPRGTSLADTDSWTLFKVEYSGGEFISKTTGYDSWNNRATANYS